MDKRLQNELKHGAMLANSSAEDLWGWGTPAGKQRAKRRAALIINGASIASGDNVLEIGCGVGMFTEIFSKSGAQITAVDLSPELLKLARERNLPEGQVKFLESPFEECKASGPFDAIIGSSVLHHLNIAASLVRIYSMLKSGGYMVFAEPNFLNPQVFIERKLRCFFKNVSPDETAFVRFILQRQLYDVGFTKVSIVPFDWLHPSVPKSMITLIDKLGIALEKVPLIKEFSGSLCIIAIK